MSNSRPLNSDKAENMGATIGFRFHANDEELEEVQMPQENWDSKSLENNVQPKTDLSTSEILDGTITEVVKEQRNLLGKRSISVDSAYESPFSNPIETWKRLNVLKEKITKTVEEKIQEMKIDRNVLSKSNRSRLTHSKENSSISDSEDTSESSKMSDHWKSSENQMTTSVKASNENLEFDVGSQDVKNVKLETETKENENEKKNKKSFNKFSDLINLSVIKVATAKTDIDGSLMDESFTEDVESGVEADENLDANEDPDSLDFDGETITLDRGGSNNPPFGGNIFRNVLGYSISGIFPQTSTIVFIVGFTLYLFFPLSEFIRGFILSFVLIIFWGTVKSYVQVDDSLQQSRPFVMPHNLMPPLKVPQSKPMKGIWFNEYEHEMYDPDYYSVTQTVPAYLELEDSILKVSRPKGKIRRRATYDEPEYKLPIISQRVYNISGCNVFLMPDGLTRKRLFSKKYPIVILLRPDSLISEKKSGKDSDEKESQEDVETEELPCLVNPVSPKNKCTLYLFARCDRQKEEWYRRLLSAARLNEKNAKTPEPSEEKENDAEKTPLDDSPSNEASTPFETLFFDDEEAHLEEYLRYMSKFVDSKSSRQSRNSEGGVEKENTEFDFSSNQVLWFNAFVNRMLFDVFRSPHWHSKIQEKVHRKLNSIRLPYYIEDIEVIEFDLGKTGPVFHRVSQPYLDERGLWFDMDLTFDGLIRLTVQTHLNLIKLQKGMEENEETVAHATEKPKKGKKSQKLKRESLLTKESKAKSSEHVLQKNRTLSKTSAAPSVLEEDKEVFISHDDPNLESKSSEVLTSNLISEVAQLAEIAVEETLSKSKQKESNVNDEPLSEPSKNRSPIYDSELEDSAESSDEDEEEDEASQPPAPEEPLPEPICRRYPKNRRSSKRIFKVFENVAQSKYFRSMAQSKYIQKAIAGVSAAKLRLTLEIKSCTGVLAVNIPPPPSDRFWYGFREMPKLVFSANPKIGDKTVRFVHIRNYLQKKILHELKAKLVQPNMVTVVCPMLAREELSPKFFNIPRYPRTFGKVKLLPELNVKKLMVLPNMIDFVLPTSAPARSSSFLQFEEQEFQDSALSE